MKPGELHQELVEHLNEINLGLPQGWALTQVLKSEGGILISCRRSTNRYKPNNAGENDKWLKKEKFWN